MGTGASNTDALVFGGYSTAYESLTETWNGTNWTEVNNLNTARAAFVGETGVNTAALAFGGQGPSFPSDGGAQTEQWNGTNWTEMNDMNTARNKGGGAGTYTAALGFGGNTAPTQVANTELWNGSSWSEQNDLNVATRQQAGSGTTTAALNFAGASTSAPKTGATEEWNVPSTTVKTISTD